MIFFLRYLYLTDGRLCHRSKLFMVKVTTHITPPVWTNAEPSGPGSLLWGRKYADFIGWQVQTDVLAG